MRACARKQPPWLVEAQQLWDCVEKQLKQMMLKTVRRSQTLEYHSSPQLCLQAHRDLHGKLQVGLLITNIVFTPCNFCYM